MASSGEYNADAAMAGRLIAREPGPEIGERGADRLAQAAADTYLVPLRLSVAARTGHVRSPGKALRLSAGAAGMVRLMMPS